MLLLMVHQLSVFQLTAARRRLDAVDNLKEQIKRVSTHSRPKAAGWLKKYEECVSKVSTHSRPKAAG